MITDVDEIKAFKELQGLYVGESKAIDLLDIDISADSQTIADLKRFMPNYMARFSKSRLSSEDYNAKFDNMLASMSDAERALFLIAASERLLDVKLYVSKLSSDLDERFAGFDWSE